MVQTILEADFLSYFQLIFFEAPIYIPRTDFSGTFVASTFKTLTVLKHFARPSPFRTSPHFMRTLLQTYRTGFPQAMQKRALDPSWPPYLVSWVYVLRSCPSPLLFHTAVERLVESLRHLTRLKLTAFKL